MRGLLALARAQVGWQYDEPRLMPVGHVGGFDVVVGFTHDLELLADAQRSQFGPGVRVDPRQQDRVWCRSGSNRQYERLLALSE